MKKAIPLLLILIGLVGVYFAMKDKQTEQIIIERNVEKDPDDNQPRKVTIAVAIAKHDISEKTILTTDDFEIVTKELYENSSDIDNFSLEKVNNRLVGWAAISAIQKEAIIPLSQLVKPGTKEYLSLFIGQGKMLYTFDIDNENRYIFDNLKLGDSIDVYFLFNDDPKTGGVIPVGKDSGSHNLEDLHLKPLLLNRPVVSVTSSIKSMTDKDSGIIEQNDPIKLNDNNSIVVELTYDELKLLKVLENKANFMIFPSDPPVLVEERNPALPGKDSVMHLPQISKQKKNSAKNSEVDALILDKELFSSVRRIEG